MGVPIIDGTSLRQFCAARLNILSKVSRDLRLWHSEGTKSNRFYFDTSLPGEYLSVTHDTWCSVSIRPLSFPRPTVQELCNLSQNWPQFQVQLTLGHAAIPHSDWRNNSTCIPALSLYHVMSAIHRWVQDRCNCSNLFLDKEQTKRGGLPEIPLWWCKKHILKKRGSCDTCLISQHFGKYVGNGSVSLFQHPYVKYRPEICDDQKNPRGTKKIKT